LKKLYLEIVLFLVISWISGCVPWATEEDVQAAETTSSSIPPSNAVEQAQYWIQHNEPAKAIELLQQEIAKNPADSHLYYVLGLAYNAQGNFSEALNCYRQSLEKNPEAKEAYLSAMHVYRVILTDIRKDADKIALQKETAKEEGNEQIGDLQKQWQDIVERRAHLYLEQAQFYLIYQNIEMNIAVFPELEAHLRDTQDLIKEIEESHTMPPRKLETIQNPLFDEILQMRSTISKKHIRCLQTFSDQEASKRNFSKAVNILKDADAQISKFYREENPTAEVSLLKHDSEIQTLAQETHQKMVQRMQESLAVHVQNRANFQKLQFGTQAEEENKTIEQLSENIVQLHIQALWRFQNIPKEQAIEHSSMIPVYERLLPELSKKGEYHYRLARCYAKQGNKAQAMSYAKQAETELEGDYRIREFLQSLEKK